MEASLLARARSTRYTCPPLHPTATMPLNWLKMVREKSPGVLRLSADTEWRDVIWCGTAMARMSLGATGSRTPSTCLLLVSRAKTRREVRYESFSSHLQCMSQSFAFHLATSSPSSVFTVCMVSALMSHASFMESCESLPLVVVRGQVGRCRGEVGDREVGS